MKAAVKKSRKAAPARKSATRKAPSLSVIAARQLKIFRLLPGDALDGGVYAGLTYTDGRIEALIIGPEYDGELDHQAAVDWATGLKVSGHSDFTLMNRVQARIAMANVPNLFRPSWYWLLEQHASGSVCAWGQGFRYGQSRWYKNLKLRARAVRRLAF